VRFYSHEKTFTLEWPSEQRDSLYIQYPVDQNYLIRLDSLKAREKTLVNKVCAYDRIEDPTFNPCSIELQRWCNTNVFMVTDKEKRGFFNVGMYKSKECFLD
jgi:hypothetical protein